MTGDGGDLVERLVSSLQTVVAVPHAEPPDTTQSLRERIGPHLRQEHGRSQEMLERARSLPADASEKETAPLLRGIREGSAEFFELMQGALREHLDARRNWELAKRAEIEAALDRARQARGRAR